MIKENNWNNKVNYINLLKMKLLKQVNKLALKLFSILDNLNVSTWKNGFKKKKIQFLLLFSLSGTENLIAWFLHRPKCMIKTDCILLAALILCYAA